MKTDFYLKFWMRCLAVLAVCLCFSLTACDIDNGDPGNGDNGGNGGNGNGGDPSCEQVLFDDFSGSLTDNWVPGSADGTHALAIEDGELVWVQNWDYIESKASFGNNLIIEFDYRAGPSSVQFGEFWVELVALTEAGHYTAGIYRGQYGTENFHAVNVGRPPSPSDSTVVDKILDPPYLETMSPGSPREGKITFSYADGKVQMQFENRSGEIIETAPVSTGDFTRTKVRIWGMSNRYIETFA